MKHFFTFTILILLILTFVPMGAFAQYNFSPYSGNPVVPKGGSGMWDEVAAWAPHVTIVNDTFYLTYNGTLTFNPFQLASELRLHQMDTRLINISLIQFWLEMEAVLMHTT